MVVSVTFHGPQRKVTQRDFMEISVPKGKRVTDVLHYVKTCYPDLLLDEKVTLVTVNDQVSSLDRTLSDDDKISFIPHIGGG